MGQELKSVIFICLFLVLGTYGTIHNAVETEMFAIPISPNLFNWTYQEFDGQYRFQASLIGKPELPSWLRYIYSGRHHSGFIFGTPPRGTNSPVILEVIGLNKQDYETRHLKLTLMVHPKENKARHEVELKIDNLNVEDLLDDHRMNRLKDIFKSKLWKESNEDLYPTFLASAIDLGARLPLRPSDGEGLVVRFGSISPFSSELKRLREEVRPLSRLPSCPRDYKRTTVERLFRDAGLTLDWCRFELYNTVYKERTTELIEYLSASPETHKSEKHPKRIIPFTWNAPLRSVMPQYPYSRVVFVVLMLPIVLCLLSVAGFTAVLFMHYATVNDPESEYFLDNIFHICTDYYKQTRAHKAIKTCRYGIENNEQLKVPDNTSSRSYNDSSSDSAMRPYSPISTTNLAGDYNRPQPPPYIGSNNNSIYHRKSGTIDQTPEDVRGHVALEESLKLLNDANIINAELDNLAIPMMKDPIIDIDDGTDDYVPIKPDLTNVSLMDVAIDDVQMKYGTIIGSI